MKKLTALLLFSCLLAGCAASPALGGQTQVLPSSSMRPVEWEIVRTPAPTPIPTPEPDGADESGFFEIDIDQSDEYRDFVMEHRYSDAYCGTRFYRLKDNAYVELGFMEGIVTGLLPYSWVPNIFVDGSGIVYAIERSNIANWARIARAYRVQDDALVQLYTDNVSGDGPFGNGALEHIKDAPVFLVTEPVAVYDTKEKTMRTLSVGETICFEYSNEVDALFARYFPPGSNEMRMVMLELEEGDCIKDGPFFGNCFYSDRVEWVG